MTETESDTTHVRMYKSDVEDLDALFNEQSRAAKLGRLLEYYKAKEQ